MCERSSPSCRIGSSSLLRIRTPPRSSASSNAGQNAGATDHVIVAPGAWSLAHAVTGGWSLLVRAVPGAGIGLARTAQSIALEGAASSELGPMEVRDFDVASLAEAVILSDRILVMKARPGRIVEDVWIDLPRPRTLEMINTARFGDIVAHIRDLLGRDRYE